MPIYGTFFMTPQAVDCLASGQGGAFGTKDTQTGGNVAYNCN